LPITYKIDSGLALITLAGCHSECRLNHESLTDLHRYMDLAVADPIVKIILLRSLGKDFCTGLDLEFIESDCIALQTAVELYAGILKKIHAAPKVVIAVINGAVKGGGVGLISACDIIVATDESTFQMPEVLFGIIPANVIPFLVCRRISMQKVRYLILTASKISAKEALAIGLIDEVHSKEDLEKKTKSIIKRLFKANPQALNLAKSFTEQVWGKEINIASDLAKEALLDIIQKPEVKKGITSFNEGKVPEWFSLFKASDSITGLKYE